MDANTACSEGALEAGLQHPMLVQFGKNHSSDIKPFATRCSKSGALFIKYIWA
jgi:hypothetical protein